MKTVKITFINNHVETLPQNVTVEAPVGLSIFEVAHKNNINIPGVCGGVLACSTCHVILDQKTYNALPVPSSEEEDMLDFAPYLTKTSRLCCQIIVTSEMDGMIIYLPKGTRNLLSSI